ARKALLHGETAALSGFGLSFRGSFAWGHGALLRCMRAFCGGSLPKRTSHMPLTSVRVECSLCTAHPVLPAFFCRPCAVYIRPNGLANSHTVCCTPPRRREGGR